MENSDETFVLCYLHSIHSRFNSASAGNRSQCNFYTQRSTRNAYSNATYRIRLHVTGSPLTQLEFNCLSVSVVSKAQVTRFRRHIGRKTVLCCFTQPVSPGTILKIDLKGIRTLIYWSYLVAATLWQKCRYDC